MNTVRELAPEWETLHKKLSTDTSVQQLAGLFLGNIPVGFSSGILFVGKATRGDFSEENAEEEWFNGVSPFWAFARKLSALTGREPNMSLNVAWTNIFKIGVKFGNPDVKLQNCQSRLAARTLAMEIADCRPSLVVIVAEGYGDEVIYAAFDTQKGDVNDFQVEYSDYGEFYFRQRLSNAMPPVLWVKHPQGKSSERTSEWLEKAKELLL